jgi:hypothetical protein
MKKSWVHQWSAASLLGGILLMGGLFAGGCTEKKSEDVRTSQEPSAAGPYGMGSPGTEAGRSEEKAQGLESTSPPLAPATPEAAKEQKPEEKQRPARG